MEEITVMYNVYYEPLFITNASTETSLLHYRRLQDKEIKNTCKSSKNLISSSYIKNTCLTQIKNHFSLVSGKTFHIFLPK